MNDKDSECQPKDLETPERLATTGRAVAQGVVHEARGEHETEKGAEHEVSAADVERIIEDWPHAQKNVARQMIDRYGSPNEATATKLFWYGNGPWKRTELSRDVVAHNWPTAHSDFLTQTIDYRVPQRCSISSPCSTAASSRIARAAKCQHAATPRRQTSSGSTWSTRL